MTNAMDEIHTLLKEIGPGRMSSTAYDTAWVARLADIDQGLSDQAMEWICENQLPDGSWGAKDIYYYHDRVICTLAAMIALTNRGRRAYDKAQIERGLLALEKITSGATQGLAADPNGATVGFEMIVPTLVAEAENLGIIKQQGERILGRMRLLRERKMSKLVGQRINKHITPVFSSEMAGMDGQAILDIDNLQEFNGSVANSPSATAYFSMYLKPNNSSAINYLHQIAHPDGGIPDFAPIDIFEIAWTLWNLRLIPDLETDSIHLINHHLDFLERHWETGCGIGTASNGTIKDGDDTSLVYEVLSHYKRNPDIQSILLYEEEEHFRCFTLESNPSISTNIHALGALRQAGYDNKGPSVNKIFHFLNSSITPDGFWLDKWHASPYYVTSHAIIASAGYNDVLVQRSVKWILKTQNNNGSWGYYGRPTLEETAYCIQSLCIFGQQNNVPFLQDVIRRASQWLSEHVNETGDPLWIGKALYCPDKVVKSSILSAIQLAKQIL